jgi:FkbM family methyltransferase
MDAVRSALKSLRTSQPFNYVTTSFTLGALNVTGLKPEFIVKHLHRVGTVRRRLPNGRTLSLWSRGDDWVSNQIYWRGWDGYEPETAPLFFKLATRAAVTVDVGAYVGYYTLIAAHANPTGRVFAFEPLPTIHKRLIRNIELNQIKNVECVPVAAGETDREASFFHIDAELPTSSSLSFEFMRPTGDLVSSSVQVTTLDRFAADRGITRIDLLKIDTESTECSVLRGMAKTLERDRPDVFCEVLQGRADQAGLAELLGPLGYRYYLLTPEGPIERDHIEGHPEWLNYLFSTRDQSTVAGSKGVGQ